MKIKTLLIALFLPLLVFSQITLEESALQKIDSLKNLIAVAQAKGIDVTKEKMSVRTAEYFLEWANWDENNIAKNTSIYEHRLPLPKARRSEYTPAELATYLPDFERSEVNLLLESSILKLQNIIDGNETRKTTTTIDWHNLNINGNKIEQSGVPVFLHDWTWKSSTDPNLIEFYGELGGSYFVPGNLEKKGNGSIGLKSWQKSTMEQDARTSSFGAPFLGQTSVPNYLKNEYPDIENVQTTFTKFDIDHPQVKQMHADLFKEVVPIFKDKNVSKLGYMISNEPHWNSSGNWDTIDPSDYTRDKFVEWLKAKHNNNINNLKAVWSTNPSSFEAAAYSITFPIPYSLQGTGQWYDWMRFNQERVTEYFLFLKNEIVKHDPNAKVHIKLIPKHWSGNLRHYGLDFEALTKLSHINGNDVGSHKSYMWGSREHWEDDYSFEWREIALAYDFFASVQPDAINYNSEAHMISTVKFRDLFLNPEYIRATHWLATLHGLDVTKNWLWSRDSDGSVPQRAEEGHSGSNLQQPRVLNEITSTMLDINSFTEEMDALQNVRKPVRVFYSETSAIISTSGPTTGTINGSKADYMDKVFDLYESIYFDGLPLGFATKDIINEQDNSTWDLIAVRDTEFVRVEEIQALQSYLDKGHTIVIDNISLKKDEYGRAHTVSLNQSAGRLIVTNKENFASTIKSQLASKGVLPAISLSETSSQGITKNGCSHRSVTLDGGRKVISIVNLSNENSVLNLSVNNSTQNYNYVNLLNGKTLAPNFTITPEQVFLIEAVVNPNSETLQILDAPVCMKESGLARFKFKYKTTTTRDIHIDLENSNTEITLQKKVSTVNGNGEITIDFSSNNALDTATNYNFNIYLTEASKDKDFIIGNNNFNSPVTIDALCDEELYNEETKPLDKIKIYRNTTGNQITIENLPNNISWKILDLTPKTLISGSHTQVDVSNLTNGVYIIQFSNGKVIKFYR